MPPPDVVPGHVVEIALEVVDRLVEAVDALEEGVGGVVHGTLEERGGLGAGLDACRGPVDRREHPLRARLADRQDALGVATRSSSRYAARPSLARHRVREHREHVPAVAFAARSDAAAVARRLGAGSRWSRGRGGCRGRAGTRPCPGRRGRSTPPPRLREASGPVGGRRVGGLRRRDRERRVALLAEPALGVERRGAAGAGGGDRLPVDVVLHVARREDAGDVGLGRLASRQRGTRCPARGRAGRGTARCSGRGRSRRRCRRPRSWTPRRLSCPRAARR